MSLKSNFNKFGTTIGGKANYHVKMVGAGVSQLTINDNKTTASYSGVDCDCYYISEPVILDSLTIDGTAYNSCVKPINSATSHPKADAIIVPATQRNADVCSKSNENVGFGLVPAGTGIQFVKPNGMAVDNCLLKTLVNYQDPISIAFDSNGVICYQKAVTQGDYICGYCDEVNGIQAGETGKCVLNFVNQKVVE